MIQYPTCSTCKSKISAGYFHFKLETHYLNLYQMHPRLVTLAVMQSALMLWTCHWGIVSHLIVAMIPPRCYHQSTRKSWVAIQHLSDLLRSNPPVIRTLISLYPKAMSQLYRRNQWKANLVMTANSPAAEICPVWKYTKQHEQRPGHLSTFLSSVNPCQ